MNHQLPTQHKRFAKGRRFWKIWRLAEAIAHFIIAGHILLHLGGLVFMILKA